MFVAQERMRHSDRCDTLSNRDENGKRRRRQEAHSQNMPWGTVFKSYGSFVRNAKRLCALAKTAAGEDNYDEEIFAQAAILMLVFAAEALINSVIEDFAPVPEVFKPQLMRLSLTEKFAYVPALCAGTIVQPFDPQVEPFKTFVTMVQTRHSWVHPRPANVTMDNLLSEASIKAVPLPKLPLHARAAHADRAYSTVISLVEWLKSTMADRITDEWLLTSEIRWK
jgi:hypothetical protein